MAWVKPVTSRRETSRTTHTDFNRMCGNINIAFGTSLKTDWTQNDIVDKTTWDTLIQTLQAYDPNITYFSDFNNLNNIEAATLRKYQEL